jgi:tRNA threonylcarbamoyladenosine biosynthesis protein TsaE
MTFFLADEGATNAFAERLFTALPDEISGFTILLDGELGAGKSSLARALIQAMGHTGPVPSPTYTLVEPYQCKRGMIYHIDLYRVSSEEELHYLGWNELAEGFRLVEWPDRAPQLAARADLKITLSYEKEGRNLDLWPLSERGSQVSTKLSS